MSDILDLSAVEQRRRIGARELSPVELLDACLARIEALNGVLNAVVTVDEAGARAAAREAEAAVMGGEPLGPLHGLPVGLKDNYTTAGIRTTWGSPALADNIPNADEESVANIRRAGGAILGKTNLPELSAGGNTNNPVFGATPSPWDLALTCGGSSGGSAVGLATGMFPLAMGTDNAGSLRIPGSFNGVVGFRPTAGVVPASQRPVGAIPFSVPGPMARDVADTWLLLQGAMARTSQDPTAGHRDQKFNRPIAPADLSRVRAVVTADQGFAPIEPGLRQVFADRIARIAPMFGEVRDADPDFDGLDRAYDILRCVLFIGTYAEGDAEQPGRFGPLVTGNLAKAQRYTIDDVGWAFAHQTRLYRGFQDYLAEVDVMICPTMGVYPWPKEELFPKKVDGKKTEGYFDYVAMTYSITLMGHPCLSVPCGIDDRGLPFGLQLVGRRNGDADLLRIAHALELAMASDPVCARAKPDLSKLTSGAG